MIQPSDTTIPNGYKRYRSSEDPALRPLFLQDDRGLVVELYRAHGHLLVHAQNAPLPDIAWAMEYAAWVRNCATRQRVCDDCGRALLDGEDREALRIGSDGK